MPIQLAGNRLQVYEYLKKISPEWAIFDDIQKNTGIRPDSQLFQIIKLLTSYGMIVSERGHFRENEWAYSVRPGQNTALEMIPQARVGAATRVEIVHEPEEDPLVIEYERLAAAAAGHHFGIPFQKSVPVVVPKMFSLVSAGGEVIGETVYFSPSESENQIRIRFSLITENVWLLEKTKARRKFLIFNSHRDVLLDWLGRFGHLVNLIEFYLLNENGQLELIFNAAPLK
jgi:hypothetical protein